MYVLCMHIAIKLKITLIAKHCSSPTDLKIQKLIDRDLMTEISIIQVLNITVMHILNTNTFSVINIYRYNYVSI